MSVCAPVCPIHTCPLDFDLNTWIARAGHKEVQACDGSAMAEGLSTAPTTNYIHADFSSPPAALVAAGPPQLGVGRWAGND
eukprot:674125-Amphidinium_carterae.3